MPDTILCPNCQTPIELTEVLSAQLRGQLRQEFEVEIDRKEKALADRERKLFSEKQSLEQAAREIDQQVAERLEGERKQLTATALAKAREQVTIELRDKDEQLSDVQGQLKAARDAELALRQERRKLEEEKNTLELTLTRRLDEERSKIRETAKKEADEERRLKDAEKDSLINTLRTQIEDLRRKSEQGSQQLQGEVLEVALEELLRRYFPFDEITPVAKGIHGGDVVQTVRDATGAVAGQILWESKRTKNWSDGWLPKLRDDQRAAKAQVAILVTIELPKEVTTFRHIDGVWVTSSPCAIPLASALRTALIEIAAAKRSVEGRNDKMEMLYSYLSGQEFRHRFEGIVEAFVTLREDLEAEKRAMQRIWAKREKQLDRAISNTSGMYGDLSGIIGGALPRISRLELPAIEGSVTDTSCDSQSLTDGAHP
jgi:hypothetical protein